MDSWVYLFSRFTSEALYIQLFLILSITGAYCVYWVTQKRKHGAIDKAVPSSIVQTYLNELISEAQVIRTQLFGLLADAGIPAPTQPITSDSISEVAEKIASDPELAGKLKSLQSKLSQQETAMANIISEKEQLEAELEKIKTAQGGSQGDADSSAPESGANAEVVNTLKEKIKNLEDRLSEYSIIEDDLANLKKLQQENAELKSKMDGKKGEKPKKEEAPTQKAEPEEKAEVKEEEESEPQLATAAEAKSTDEEPVEASTDDQNFEGLVDKVEASLSPEEEIDPKQEEPKSEEEPKKQKASEDGGEEEKKDESDPLSNVGKSDDDLLSEFEKMLNM